ncbi:MAG: dockerin type I repeat-containing protein [Phycisphaerae bacterium]
MRKFMLASTVALFIVGQTMGASTVTMELELGGSNNGATCATPIYFTPGSTEDGQYALDENGRLTWAARIHASGTHLDASQQEVAIRGIANFVFDLELYHDAVNPANLVTTATFMSTANQQMTNCGVEQNWSNVPAGMAYLSNAAFAVVFDTNTSTAIGPGRAVDYYRVTDGHPGGGPRMDVRCYPKAAAGEGTLQGVGAGYSLWNKSSLSLLTVGGIGRGDFASIPGQGRPYGYLANPETKASGDPSYGWLGYGPVVEGQIEGLQPGVTYILRLVPGGGINVLRGGTQTQVSSEVFAIAADTVHGDDITFTVAPPQQPVQIVGWSSVRDCGGIVRAISLDPAPSVGQLLTTETRKDGVQMIQIDFDGDITSRHVPGQVSLSNDLNLVSEAVINGGQSLSLTVSNSQDGYCYTVDISGAISGLAAGQDTNCSVQVLAGDVNGDGTVSTTDIAFLKSKIGRPIEGNERFDLTCDGVISTTDIAYLKSRVGRQATCW